MTSVERSRVDLEITELLIDPAKEEYLARTKQVGFQNILEVLFNAPHYFVLTRSGRTRYNVLGPNQDGRYLLTAIAHVDSTRWRVVTAHWMEARRGNRLYEGGLQ